VFSPEYYALCAGGGMLAAGATHLAITPLDVLKVNMQVSGFFLVGRVLPAALPCGELEAVSSWPDGFVTLYSGCSFLMLCEFGDGFVTFYSGCSFLMLCVFGFF
jgi:hypothetical protein